MPLVAHVVMLGFDFLVQYTRLACVIDHSSTTVLATSWMVKA